MVMLMFATRYGATPLHMAAAAGHLSTVKAVLEAGGGDDCQFHDQLIVEAISTLHSINVLRLEGLGEEDMTTVMTLLNI